MTQIIQIPDPFSPQFGSSVKQWIGVRDGIAGPAGLKPDRFVTVGDLYDPVFINALSGYQFPITRTNPSGQTGDQKAPRPPTNLQITSEVFRNILTWDDPTSDNFWYIEVFRAKVPAGDAAPTVGDAVKIATVPKGVEVFIDTDVSATSYDYYYWIRAVSYAGIASLWQDGYIEGSTTVSSTIDGLLDILTGQVTETQLYADLNTRLDIIETNESAIAVNVADISDGKDGIWASISSKVQVTTYKTDFSIYDSTTTYYKNNQVQYNGHLYECVNDNSGVGISNILPTDTNYWECNDGLIERTGIAEQKLWVGTGGGGTPGSPASDSLLAQWTVKLNINNHIAGVGLALDESGFSQFQILCDQFAIINPTDEGLPAKIPFTVGTVGGETVVGIDGNLVVDGTIYSRSINVDEVFVGMTIQSTIYDPGVTGWQINANGDVDFTSGTTTWSLITGVGKPADYADVTSAHSQAVAWLTDAGALALADDLDGVPDGTYGKVLTTAISAGKIVLTSAGVSGTLPTSLSAAKCTDALADQTSAHSCNDPWSGHDLDDLANGTYGKVLTTAISAGKIVLTSAGVSGTLPTSLSAAKCTDANADRTSTHTAANASAYTGASIATGYTAAKCTDANADRTSTHTAYDTVRVNNLASTTIILAGKIGTGLVVADSINVGNLSAISADMGSITAGTITMPNTGWIKGGQTAFATGTGFFLGYSSGAYKFSFGSSTKNIKWDGSDLSIIGSSVNVPSAGDTPVASTIRPVRINPAGWLKTKEITIPQAGAIRIKFTLWAGTGASVIQGRIYKNGSPVGTLRTKHNTLPTTYSEDISGWSCGDLCQLYANLSSGDYGYVSQFLLYADTSLTYVVTIDEETV